MKYKKKELKISCCILMAPVRVQKREMIGFFKIPEIVIKLVINFYSIVNPRIIIYIIIVQTSLIQGHISKVPFGDV
jgi:hypothetical protein